MRLGSSSLRYLEMVQVGAVGLRVRVVELALSRSCAGSQSCCIGRGTVHTVAVHAVNCHEGLAILRVTRIPASLPRSVGPNKVVNTLTPACSLEIAEPSRVERQLKVAHPIPGCMRRINGNDEILSSGWCAQGDLARVRSAPV